MLLVRQGFHGAILTGPEMPIAEFYGYSLAGLVVAIGLLVAGIRLPDKALRLAGLILLTATIVKVFVCRRRASWRGSADPFLPRPRHRPDRHRPTLRTGAARRGEGDRVKQPNPHCLRFGRIRRPDPPKQVASRLGY